MNLNIDLILSYSYVYIIHHQNSILTMDDNSAESYLNVLYTQPQHLNYNVYDNVSVPAHDNDCSTDM